MELSVLVEAILVIDPKEPVGELINLLGGLAAIGVLSSALVDILKLTPFRNWAVKYLVVGELRRSAQHFYPLADRVIYNAWRQTAANADHFYRMKIAEIFSAFTSAANFAFDRAARYEKDPSMEIYWQTVKFWTYWNSGCCGAQHLEETFKAAFPEPPKDKDLKAGKANEESEKREDDEVTYDPGELGDPELEEEPLAWELSRWRKTYLKRDAEQVAKTAKAAQAGSETKKLESQRQEVSEFMKGTIKGAEIRVSYRWELAQQLLAVAISCLTLGFLTLDAGLGASGFVLGLLAGAFAPISHDIVKRLKTARAAM